MFLCLDHKVQMFQCGTARFGVLLRFGLRQPMKPCLTMPLSDCGCTAAGEVSMLCVRCRVSSPPGLSCQPSRATVALRFAWTSACVSWSTRAALLGKMRPRDGGKLGWHPPGLLRRELPPLVTLQVLVLSQLLECVMPGGRVLLQTNSFSEFVRLTQNEDFRLGSTNCRELKSLPCG